MKNTFIVLLMFVTSTVFAQQHQLEKIWETDTVVAIPESVLPVENGKALYIALIDGAPWEADGKGGIGKMSADGTIINDAWITGLNAPKGMGIQGNLLYVADITEVVVIDIKKSKVIRKIAIDSAQALNDITVDSKGAVYVSDSRTARVWKIVKNKPSLYLEGMNGINGLKAIGSDLFILSGKKFVKADEAKNITSIAELPQGGDGIEPIGNGDFLVTAWSGYIFYVYADGKYELLLDTHLEKKNTADIGYDADKRIMYVPTFNAKTVVAYKVN